tara:strand:+ start:620 stop:1105 length:486 start_codon:yes stop_codon:yes gene_type:complete
MTEKLSAKEILKNKFWIVESEGEKVATLSIGDDSQLMYSSNNTGTRFYKNIKALTKNLNADITWSPIETVNSKPKEFEIYGFSTSCAPYNPMFNVKQRLALFTKSKKSKSLYCAGYFIIRFDKGWVKSFCPKLITVERYETEGPFKTDLEMRQQLSRANAR